MTTRIQARPADPASLRCVEPPGGRPKPVLRRLPMRPQASPVVPLRAVPAVADPKPYGLMERIAAGILTIDDLAWLLRSSVDTVRRIPRDRLPAYRGPGRYRLYFLDDLRLYVRSGGLLRPGADEILSAVAGQVLESRSDSGRERSPQGERDE